MKLEPDLDFQLHAIEAVCDLFRGQEVCRSEFTVTPGPSEARERLFAENHLGNANATRRASGPAPVAITMNCRSARER